MSSYMSRLAPLTCLSFLIALFSQYSLSDEQPEADRQKIEVEEIHAIETNLILNQIEQIGEELNKLSARSELPENVALAATSALIYIAFNVVHNKIINLHDPEYDILHLYTIPENTWYIYGHIMTLVNYLLPAGLVGTLTMTLAKYHDDLPEISSWETLKIQALSHAGVTLPFSILQGLVSHYSIGLPFMSADTTSSLLQKITYYGPYAVAGIYYTLSRMSRGNRADQLTLQLRNLRQQLPDISARARQQLIHS